MNHDTSDSLSHDLGYGSSSKKIEPYGIEHIPATDRHGKPYTQFTTWMSGSLTLSLLVLGFFPTTLGLSVWQSLSAVIVGSFIGSLIMGILATMGVRLGVAIQIQARGPLGYAGNLVPVSFINVFASVGWATVNSVFAAMALRQVVNVPFWLAAALILGVVAVLSVWGYNLLHLVNKIATAVLGVLFAVITVLALSKADWTYAANPQASGYVGPWGGWITAVGFFLAWFFAWAPFASDFARYLPVKTSATRVAAFTAAGNFIPALWLGCTGVLVANFAGSLGPVEAVVELTGPWAPLAMFALVLGCLPTNGLTVYGGALSLLTLGIRVSRHVAALIIVAISLGLTIAFQNNIFNVFYDFLLLSGYFIAPYVAVMLLDYFVGGRKKIERLGEIFDKRRHFEWGFMAWVCGCVASAPFWVWTLWTGPVAAAFPQMGDISYYVGAAVAAVIYLATLRLQPFSKNRRNSRLIEEGENIPV